MSVETFARLADAYEDMVTKTQPRKGREPRGLSAKYKRCDKCGLRIKSKGHDNGESHIRRSK